MECAAFNAHLLSSRRKKIVVSTLNEDSFVREHFKSSSISFLIEWIFKSIFLSKDLNDDEVFHNVVWFKEK